MKTVEWTREDPIDVLGIGLARKGDPITVSADVARGLLAQDGFREVKASKTTTAKGEE